MVHLHLILIIILGVGGPSRILQREQLRLIEVRVTK